MDLLEVLHMQLRGDLAVCSQLLLSVTKLISTPENTNSPNANNVKRQNIHIVRGVRHRCMLVTFIHTPKPQGYRRTSPLPLEIESTITLTLLLCLPRCQDFPEQFTDQYYLEYTLPSNPYFCFNVQICSDHSLGHPWTSESTEVLAPSKVICRQASQLWYLPPTRARL